MRTVWLFLMLVILVGCATSQPKPELVDELTVISTDPLPPEGVVRKYWEEPKVKYEQNGPGLDSTGNWYIPRHTAVREVKMGRWVTCGKK